VAAAHVSAMGGAMTILQLLVVVPAVESTTLAVKLEVP